MFGLIVGIAALAAFVTVIVKLTLLAMSWLSNKVKEKLRNRNTQKVAVCDIKEMVSSCENNVSMAAFEELSDQGATHLVAEVDYYGNIESVEAIDADRIETQVDNMINRTGEGMVVISA